MKPRHILSKSIALLFLVALPIFVSARTVDLVLIDEEGKSMELDDRLVEKCRSFKPTVDQVTHYFNYAYPIEADFATRDRYTPCYARGTVTFSDNFSGEWLLYSSGTASFNFRRGDFVSFFYKKNEWYDPTAGEYIDRQEIEY